MSELITSLDGADFASDLAAPSRVTADSEEGVYAPHWNPGLEPACCDLAWAFYVFTVPGFSGGRWLCNSWTSPPADETLWLGLGNLVEGRWDWYQALPDGVDDDRVLITDLAPYLGEDEALLLAVALTDDGEFTLSRLWLEGQPPTLSQVTQSGVGGAEPVIFSSDAAGDEPLAFSWDFGEGADPSTSTDREPAVTLGPAGVYTGSLEVENPLGSCQLEFQYNSMVPLITSIEPLGGLTGATVTFRATVIGAEDPCNYHWDFDGTDPDTCDLEEFETTLGAVGEHDASLTVNNSYGEDTFEFTLTIVDWPAQLWIFPDPEDDDWAGVLGSGTEDDLYVVSSQEPPFNSDYTLYFSLAANGEPDGSGIDIDPAWLSWNAVPPFIVEDPAWSTPGVFQAKQFTNGYIFALNPHMTESNHLYVVSHTSAP